MEQHTRAAIAAITMYHYADLEVYQTTEENTNKTIRFESARYSPASIYFKTDPGSEHFSFSGSKSSMSANSKSDGSLNVYPTATSLSGKVNGKSFSGRVDVSGQKVEITDPDDGKTYKYKYFSVK